MFDFEGRGWSDGKKVDLKKNHNVDYSMGAFCKSRVVFKHFNHPHP